MDSCSAFTAPPIAHICMKHAHVFTPPVGYRGFPASVNEKSCNTKRQRKLYNKKNVGAHLASPPHVKVGCTPVGRTWDLEASLSRQVWMYIRPGEHLFAILENSTTLRRDWNFFFFRQVSLNFQSFRQESLCISGLFDAIGLFTVEDDAQVSPGYRMYLDLVTLKSCPQS